MTPELRELTARIQRLENDLLRRPVILPAPVGSRFRTLLVGSGNTLATIGATTVKGLKRASTLTSVPTLAPTAIGATYADGLTAAYDLGMNPTATSGPLVWLTSAFTITIKNPSGGADTTVSNVLQFQVSETSPILSLSSFQVPCTTGGYAAVYVPYVVGA
jgi:hypothetical protein